MSSDCVSDHVKVLYIAGMMRSGSTLLGRLLGELPGAFDVGELGQLLSPAFRDYGRCGCLQPVYECEFWQAVLERAFGGIANLDLQALHETRQAYRIRTLPRLLLARKTTHERRLEEYIKVLDALYCAVQAVSGARVIVDASKDSFFGYLVSRVPSLDLRAVHLVRDSRAVAYSQMRVKSDPPLFSNPGSLPIVSPARTAMLWNAANLLLSVHPMSDRTLFLRYEDLVRDPQAALSRLWAWMDEPPPPLEFLQSSVVSLQGDHTVAGNPDRFQSTVRIRLDDAWQSQMKWPQRRLVTALTFPLLLRYGYLRSGPVIEGVKRNQPSSVL